jgi:hypothetical protein
VGEFHGLEAAVMFVEVMPDRDGFTFAPGRIVIKPLTTTQSLE